MEKSLKGTRTAENLMRAFAGESQARNRYTFYASIAKKEGFIQISNIFKETADNEKEHAEMFFKHLKDNMNGENVTIHEAGYPVDWGITLEILKAAAKGENEEHTIVYPEFARIAREEGFNDIGTTFEEIAEVEQKHEARFLKLANNIEKGLVFKRDVEVLWKCNNCGYIHKGTEAPEVCPACKHDQGYYELFVENY